MEKYQPEAAREEKILFMEFALFGLAEHSFLSKVPLDSRLQFRDMLSSMLDKHDDEYSSFDDDMFV